MRLEGEQDKILWPYRNNNTSKIENISLNNCFAQSQQRFTPKLRYIFQVVTLYGHAPIQIKVHLSVTLH